MRRLAARGDLAAGEGQVEGVAAAGDQVADHPGEHLAGKFFVLADALLVRGREAFDGGVEPEAGLAFARRADLDLAGRRRRHLAEGDAEHVFVAGQEVAAAAQQLADLGVGEARQLHPQGGAALAVGSFDPFEVRHLGQAAETQAGDLVERRMGSAPQSDAAGQPLGKHVGLRVAAERRRHRRGQLRGLVAFDPFGQMLAAE